MTEEIDYDEAGKSIRLGKYILYIHKQRLSRNHKPDFIGYRSQVLFYSKCSEKIVTCTKSSTTFLQSFL
jgi:hypothetical protein